jgi:biotin carboxyl carrier protein
LLEAANASAASLASALAPPRPAPRDAAHETLELQAILLDATHDLKRAATTLVSSLAQRLGFERVSMGLTQGHALTITALSHAAEFDTRQPLVRALTETMQEAMDQAVSISYPQPEQALPRVVLAHAELATLGPGRIVTVPLASAGECIGALCFERAAAVNADEQRRIEDLGKALAPLVALKERAERSWPVRAREAACARWPTSRRWPSLALGGLALAVAAAMMVPVGYGVGAPARLEGTVQRGLAAPADGFLQAVHVRPGDPVKNGDVLVEMADQDLLLEQQKLEAEVAQHENSAAAALAQSDRAQFAVAQAKADEAQAQLELTRSQLERGRVVAPIDGVVISGDLSQALGAPVQRGQVLLTVAPREGHRLIVDVDQRDIASVRTGQRGQLALAAAPDQHLAFTVQRVTPVAVAKEGRNTFEIEAQLDSPNANGLRPGLLGVAKIDVGGRSLWTIATRPLIDALRLAWWRWGP